MELQIWTLRSRWANDYAVLVENGEPVSAMELCSERESNNLVANPSTYNADDYALDEILPFAKSDRVSRHTIGQ